MRKLATALMVMAMCAGAATANPSGTAPAEEVTGPSRDDAVFGFDDIRAGKDGWVDVSGTARHRAPRFHVDGYMGPPDQVMAELDSCVWWCGVF